jgi:hypothetical protein
MRLVVDYLVCFMLMDDSIMGVLLCFACVSDMLAGWRVWRQPDAPGGSCRLNRILGMSMVLMRSNVLCLQDGECGANLMRLEGPAGSIVS